MKPVYFGKTGKQLFGVYHEPQARRAVDAAVLLCYPLVQEYMRTHWALRKLAGLLAREGHHVLRFDYTGTGDSTGDVETGSVTQWCADIRLAAAELEDSRGRTPRLGGRAPHGRSLRHPRAGGRAASARSGALGARPRRQEPPPRAGRRSSASSSRTCPTRRSPAPMSCSSTRCRPSCGRASKRSISSACRPAPPTGCWSSRPRRGRSRASCGSPCVTEAVARPSARWCPRRRAAATGASCSRRACSRP